MPLARRGVTSALVVHRRHRSALVALAVHPGGHSLKLDAAAAVPAAAPAMVSGRGERVRAPERQPLPHAGGAAAEAAAVAATAATEAGEDTTVRPATIQANHPRKPPTAGRGGTPEGRAAAATTATAATVLAKVAQKLSPARVRRGRLRSRCGRVRERQEVLAGRGRGAAREPRRCLRCLGHHRQLPRLARHNIHRLRRALPVLHGFQRGSRRRA